MTDEKKEASGYYRFKHLVEEFGKESDRAAVILVAAVLDQALDNLLRGFLVPSTSATDELFEVPNAPLSTFSSRIHMAYRLGLISDKLSRDLHLVRKIRNEFAHNIERCDFGQASIKSRVLELERSAKIIERQPAARDNLPKGTRSDFLFITGWFLYNLQAKIDKLEPLQAASR